MNGASSPPLLYAECASTLETGLFPVHARWCPRGSRKGAWRDFRAARDVSRRTRGPDETAPVIRPSGQDAGPTSPVERRGPRGRRSCWRSRRPSRPGPQRGACAATGLRPLPGPFLPEHCPSFTTRAARRGHQIPCLFWTLHPLWTLFYYFCLIKASPRPDATPTVSVVCSSRHNIFI